MDPFELQNADDKSIVKGCHFEIYAENSTYQIEVTPVVYKVAVRSFEFFQLQNSAIFLNLSTVHTHI